MLSSAQMPSTTSIFSTYASFAAFFMLVQSIVYQFIPYELRTYLLSIFRGLLATRSSKLTLVIEEFDGLNRNQVYEDSETYLSFKISPLVERLRVRKPPREKAILVTIDKGEEIIDSFEGIQLKWKLIFSEKQPSNPDSRGYSFPQPERRAFELTFQKKYKERVLSYYLPYVLDKAEVINEENKVIKLYTLGNTNGRFYGGDGGIWSSINLEHPSTFDKLAMDPELKMALIDDLDRFVKRKDFYKRVGKAWKRGYLLYGPPGTGKSSLIAVMANYLKFDVYDLELTNIYSDSDLRSLLVATGNRSILVIEDIDCSKKVQHREFANGANNKNVKLTLSGLLNFIDGLWSSCGDERIIVFTTNHKDRLDPALLRPGRMDMHIHMSYCTPSGFDLLVSNYLNVQDHHPLFEEIKGLIEDVEVTPAEIAEELLKNDDAEIVLEGLVQFLSQKKIEKHTLKDEKEQKVECEEDEENENEAEGNDSEPEITRRMPLRRVYRGRGGRIMC